MTKKSWKMYRIWLYSLIIIGWFLYAGFDQPFKNNKETNASNFLKENDSSVLKWNEVMLQFANGESNWNNRKNAFDSIVFGERIGSGGASSLLGIYNNRKQNFLYLPWLTLKSTNKVSVLNDFRILVKNNTTYLSKMEYTKNGMYYTPLKKVGFFVDPNEYLNEFSPNGLEKLDIYIPIKSKISYYILTGLNILWFLTVILSALFLFRSAGSFLLAISNNKAFEWDNVQRLKYCVWVVSGLILFQYIVMLILYLCYYSTIHGYVQVKSWMDTFNWKLWVMLVIYFSLFLAFFRGYKLQTDQEYTI